VLVIAAVIRQRHVTERAKITPVDFREVFKRLHKCASAAGGTPPQLLRNIPTDATRPLQRQPNDSSNVYNDSKGNFDLYAPHELPRNSIRLDNVLGKGQFGQVVAGVMDTKVGRIRDIVQVAVKVSLHDKDADAFLEEAYLTWTFVHENVIQMHGVVTVGREPKLIVLELCANGSLLNHVRAANPEHMKVERLLGVLQGTAAGMAYLTSRRCVHRDLAARNVLLDDDYAPKICDFGLMRAFASETYYRITHATLLPLRWTDPEALVTQVFGEATDVWSFGVLAIEAFTRGATPYGTWSNALVHQNTMGGYRLPRPPAMPELVYTAIVLTCWYPVGPRGADLPCGRATDASSTLGWDVRPTFATLHTRLANILCGTLIIVPSDNAGAAGAATDKPSCFDADIEMQQQLWENIRRCDADYHGGNTPDDLIEVTPSASCYAMTACDVSPHLAVTQPSPVPYSHVKVSSV
jgi:serine/threonine protein kinase